MIQRIKLTMVNAYLLEAGDGFILVDTGISKKWDSLEAKLLKVGALPDRLKLVILTHGDFDHTGNGAQLQQKYKVKVAIHQEDAFMVEKGEQPVRKINNLFFKTIIGVGDLLKIKSNFDKFKPDFYLTDEQSLEEYGFKGKIIHVPGHTKGSIVVLTDEGDLVAGDLFSNFIKPGVSPFVENENERISSVKRIKALNIREIYPGHGTPFSSVYLFGYQEKSKA